MPEHVLAHPVPSKHKGSGTNVVGVWRGRLFSRQAGHHRRSHRPCGSSAGGQLAYWVRRHRRGQQVDQFVSTGPFSARPICRWSRHRVPPPRPPLSRPASVDTCCLSLGCGTPAWVFLIPTADPPTLVGTLHRHFPPSPGLPTVPAPAWHSGPPPPMSVCVLAPPVPAPTPPAAPCTEPAGTLGTAPPRRPGCNGNPRLGLAGSRKMPCRLPTGWRPGRPQSQT